MQLKRIAHRLSVAALLTTAFGPSQASGFCLPMFGEVRLTPETPPTCTVAAKIPGAPFVGSPLCFRVEVRGLYSGSGFAGVTSDTLYQALPPGSGSIQTPAVLLAPQARQVVTAQAVLNLPGGSVLTNDIILESPERTGGTVVTEQLVITGGTGIYEQAGGNLVVLGDSRGKWASFRGSLCFP